jgi:hypothetical protein
MQHTHKAKEKVNEGEKREKPTLGGIADCG